MTKQLKMNLKLLLLATLLISSTQAGVVRIENPTAMPSERTESMLTETTTVTTAETDVATTTLSSTNEAPALAVTRDEPASIVIEIDHKSLLDPAPGTQEEDSEVFLEQLATQDNKAETVRKSAPLLLLSTRSNEKPKEQEENIVETEALAEEEADTEAATTTESTTDATVATEQDEITTVLPPVVEECEHWSEHDNAPLAALNETHAAACNSEQGTPAQLESLQTAPNDKFGAALLIADDSSEFVLIDGDVEQWSSFTHIDSDEHLQPIVQSVEIVPASVDDALLVNFVQSW